LKDEHRIRFLRIVPSLLGNDKLRSPFYDKISNMESFFEIKLIFLIYIWKDFYKELINKPYDAIYKVSSFSPLPY